MSFVIFYRKTFFPPKIPENTAPSPLSHRTLARTLLRSSLLSLLGLPFCYFCYFLFLFVSFSHDSFCHGPVSFANPLFVACYRSWSPALCPSNVVLRHSDFSSLLPLVSSPNSRIYFPKFQFSKFLVLSFSRPQDLAFL